MFGATPSTAGVEDLVARHRGPELAHVRTMLGAGQRGDGLRVMRIDAAAGLGASALLDVVAGGWNEGPVVALDARRRDGLGEEARGGAEVALELRARSAASRIESHAERGRVLLTIDHAWEDDLAASLYGALVDALDEDQDVSVLLVRRVDAGTAIGTWHEILEEIARRRPMPNVALAPLGDATIDELVQLLQPGRTALERGRIVGLSGGVPAIAAILAAGGTGVPETLREWVDARLDDLDEAHADAVLTLALVDAGLVADAIAVEPDSLPFALQHASGSWSIEPPAVRAAVIERASTARRRVVAAEAEERLSATSTPGALADRARLHALSGDRAGSRQMWTTLADELERAGQLEPAVVARRYAIGMSTSVEEQLEAVAAAARTIREQGLRSPSEDILLQLRRLATAAGDVERMAWSIRELAFARNQLDLLEDPILVDSPAGWAIEAQAAAAAIAGRYEQCAERATVALERARQTGDTVLELYARGRIVESSVVVAPDSPHAGSADDAANELAAIVQPLWDAGARHRALFVAETEGYVLRFTLRWSDLIERMRSSTELARAAGRTDHAVKLTAYEVEALIELGRLDDAAALQARIEQEVDPSIDNGSAAAYVGLGALMLAVETGVEARIRDRERALVESGALDLYGSLRGVHDLLRLRQALELRDIDGAVELAANLPDIDDDDLAAAVADVARWAAEQDVQALRDAALALRGRVRDRPGAPLITLQLQEADACLADAPIEPVAAAASHWREHGCELRALRLEVVLAHRDATWDDERLRDLKARLRRAGMRGAEDRINAIIRDRGGRAVARATPRGEAPLSERERQVVELAVEGLTNAQVGERLGIRPATVARILANVYKRHDLRGRASLVSFLDTIDR